MTEEMIKLRQMLKAKKIEYIDRSDPEWLELHIDRTHFIVEGKKTHFFSVVHGFGTYGGKSHHESDKGLLEVQVNHKDPEGYKTAEDVMKMVEEIKKRVKGHLFSNLAMICSVASFIIAMLNLIFFNSDFLRGVVWTLVFIVMALDFLVLLKWHTREQDENILLCYENLILKASYIQMGEYIQRLNIPELDDIELRIENELRDIEIKKQWQAEKLGIKTKEADND